MTRRQTSRYPQQPPRDPSDLGPVWRGLLALVGIATLAFGTLAVFRTKAEAGPTALIAIGAVMLVIAAGGRAVTHFEVGNAKVDMETREKAQDSILASAGSDSHETALARIETASIFDPGVLSEPKVAAYAFEIYEGEAKDALEAALPEGFSLIDPANLDLAGPFPYELLIVGPGVSGLVVEIDLAPNGSAHPRKGSHVDEMLIVCPEMPPRTRRTSDARISWAVWNGPADDERLKASVHKALGLPTPRS
ncbi:hypothetical protein [Streptacidiphilus sp. P02-A3a]|uniref:hypothetical protein n=1 Tax=Streptacidiphilus sp. P02-A3a TaxID=2704468 RepID=UPI0015FD2DE1|nr:hypothetical protein [Streptacidiphilus sp. P02-A3a]QMU68350.1 hypothetical protein GXP74_09030 [Streptacidiphilus sp. P02-A3a]